MIKAIFISYFRATYEIPNRKGSQFANLVKLIKSIFDIFVRIQNMTFIFSLQFFPWFLSVMLFTK